MKTWIFVALVSASTAFAAGEASIRNFSVVREGGGQLEAVVAKDGSGRVVVYTKSCSFKTLSEDQQMQTRFQLSGMDASDALAILNNQAILASDQTPHGPLLTGTWLRLRVDFSYSDFSDHLVSQQKTINEPIVLIQSRLSEVLQHIESKARLASQGVCQE